MKEPYEKPKMVTEEVETGTLYANAGSSSPPGQGPISCMEPFFGLCCP